MKKRSTMNGKMVVDYYDGNPQKYVKDDRYRITLDGLRDAYFVSTQHVEYILSEFLNVITELKKELELYTNKEEYSQKTEEVLQYTDNIISAYITLIHENAAHEKYLKERHNI